MSLKLAKPTSAALRFAQGYTRPDDPDAVAYIAAVETADGQALETATRMAINAFVKGCKADGIWPALKASCILAGARTLNGALVPLVGTAPTNFNFVSGDYNRKTGLVGNGTTKYLNSNRTPSSSPQNSIHVSVYCSSIASAAAGHAGARANASSANDLLLLGSATINDVPFRVNYSGADGTGTRGTSVAGFMGASRSASASIVSRISGTSETIANVSAAPVAQAAYVFAFNSIGTAISYSNARLSFYSIGESLDLALLDTRVTALINALAAAIP